MDTTPTTAFYFALFFPSNFILSCLNYSLTYVLLFAVFTSHKTQELWNEMNLIGDGSLEPLTHFYYQKSKMIAHFSTWIFPSSQIKGNRNRPRLPWGSAQITRPPGLVHRRRCFCRRRQQSTCRRHHKTLYEFLNGKTCQKMTWFHGTSACSLPGDQTDLCTVFLRPSDGVTS